MHRLAAAAVLAFLLSASAAYADGPGPYALQGGTGVLSANGTTRYLALGTPTSTVIEKVAVPGGAVLGWMTLRGAWGIPAVTLAGNWEGLSRDGRTLVVAKEGVPAAFARIRTRNMRLLGVIAPRGSFGYDALSPDGSRLYLIERTDANDYNRYVVRAYDVRAGRLLPGRIADKTQRTWVMQGSPVERTTSPDGRWVYTLYQNPGGYPFVHALDTVRGVAHCTGLPWSGDQAALWDVVLRLSADGKTLAVDRTAKQRWLTVDTQTWRIEHVRAAAFPWRWIALGIAGAAVLLALALGARRARGLRYVPTAT